MASVKDAATLVLDTGTAVYNVRLYGIVPPAAGQPGAGEAAQYLRSRVLGQRIFFRFQFRNDRDEMVGAVRVGGQDVGIEMAQAGLVWRAPGVRYKADRYKLDPLTAAEQEARLAKRGVWSHSDLKRPPIDADLNRSLTASLRGGETVEEPDVSGNLDLNLSKKSGDEDECAVAEDPTNPERLFMVCNVDSTNALFAARSTNGGVTWTYPDPSDKTIADGDAGQGVAACCDGTLSWDSFGNLFVTYIDSGVGHIVTLLSTDGGQTFSPLASFADSVDQPTVVTGKVGAGGVVWVVWHDFTVSPDAMVARGAAVSGLGVVGSFTALQAAPSTSGCSFGDIVVSPTGKVLQVCESPDGDQGPANLLLSVDADGLGAGNFAAPTTITATNVGGFDFIPPQNSRSVDAEAGLAYDKNPSSPHFGRLYLVYLDETVNENNDTDVKVRYSDNDGTTWSSAIRVNDDATTRSQFNPKIATDPVTGDVGVCWHDCRNDAADTHAEMWCSYSIPTSASVPVFSANFKVSDGTSLSNGLLVEFGDYLGMAVGGGFVHPGWADTSNSTGDNPDGTAHFDIYSDYTSAGGLFFDGFETGNTTRWSVTVP